MTNSNTATKAPAQGAGAKVIRDALAQFHSLRHPVSMAQTKAIIAQAKAKHGIDQGGSQ